MTRSLAHVWFWLAPRAEASVCVLMQANRQLLLLPAFCVLPDPLCLTNKCPSWGGGKGGKLRLYFQCTQLRRRAWEQSIQGCSWSLLS